MTAEQPTSPDTNSSAGEISLTDQPSFFRGLVDGLSVCMLVKDLSGRIIYANQATAEAMGRPKEEILGSFDADLFPENLATKYRNDDLRVIDTGEPLVAVEENRKGEEAIYFEVRKAPLRNAVGDIVGVKAIFWDVSKRYAAEKALEREQFLLRTLMENLPDSIYFKDRESRFVRGSRGQAQKFGFADPAEIIGKTDADIFSAEHANAARADEERIMRTGEPVIELVERETWESREDTWCLSSKLPLYNEAGEIVGTFGMSRDITKLMKTEEALRKAKEEADAANRAKSDFLANMSHEIRTPMNAVIGITELLLEDNPTPHQREYLSMVLASGESLLAIINDILDFSKIESGKFELLPVACNLQNALGDTIKTLGVRAHEKNLELACQFDPQLPDHVTVDIGRLRQILVNLVGNAIKFTDKGEVIVTVSSKEVADAKITLCISVRDTGVGIPADKQTRIFSAFEQADGSTTKTYGGTGLGLAISARLARLMGGDVSVASELGVGSTFELQVACDVIQRSNEHIAQPIEALAGTRIMIVDDNQTNRRILCDVLRNWDLIPVSASSAAEAIKRLRRSESDDQTVAMMITDINMPHTDGFGLVEAVRKIQKFAELPIVALTSAPRKGDRERCRQLRIARQISKPIKQSELMSAISETLCAEGSSAHSVPDPIQPERQASKRLRVLVAEDNVVNQQLTAGVLGKLGHEYTLASTGEEALQLSRSQAFDVILMDVQMPVMDGYEATRQIRSDEQASGAHVPIVAMTARAMQGDREACFRAGMDDYLPKPVRASELAAALASLESVDEKAVADHVEEGARATAAGSVNWNDALEYVSGNRVLLASVISALQEEGPKLRARIEQGVSAGNATMIRKGAHALKGSLLFLGETEAVSYARQMEQSGERQDIDTARELLPHLQSAMRQLLKDVASFDPS